ncbi:MAG: vWA domain-containing protein [Planctomycetota bacterium]
MELEQTASMRRLPVYLLLDCSASMAGEPISAMEMGLRGLIGELRSDPQALDTVWVSVIAFSSAAELVAPLTDLAEIDVPDLDASGTTALGEAVQLLSERIHDEVRQTTRDQKGDWKPMVFVFTDGEPTDDWEDPVDDFRASGLAVVVACGAGPEVDDVILKRLGHHAIRLHDTQPGTLAAFMQWVTVSVTERSHSVGSGSKKVEELPPPPQGVMLVP